MSRVDRRDRGLLRRWGLVVLVGVCNFLLITLLRNPPVQAQEKCDQISPLDDPNAKPPPRVDPEWWEKQLRLCRKVTGELKRRAALSPSELKKLPPPSFPFSYAMIENCRDEFMVFCHQPKIPPATYNPSGPWPRAMGMSTPAPGPPVFSMSATHIQPAKPSNTPSQINPPRFPSRLITP